MKGPRSVPPIFQHQHAVLSVGRQPVRHHAAGRARANDDEVEGRRRHLLRRPGVDRDSSSRMRAWVAGHDAATVAATRVSATKRGTMFESQGEGASIRNGRECTASLAIGDIH